MVHLHFLLCCNQVFYDWFVIHEIYKKKRKEKKSAQSEGKSENEKKKNIHYNREKDTNSKWHTIELSTVLLPSENMEAVVLPLLRYR